LVLFERNMLKNLKILELANVLAGPSVGMFFSELGAKVTKVENKNTDGDLTRKWLLPNEYPSSVSAYFSSVNYNKTHIFLDYNAEIDRVKIENLIKECDIVITNFKAGDAEKFNLTFEECKKLNKSIIYAHLGGFKSNIKRVAFDVVLQAETGFMSMNGEPNRAPVKMPVALIDILAAHQIKEGILIALINRNQNKKAIKVSTTLEESAIASLANQASNYLMLNHIAKPIGTKHPNIAPYGDMITTKNGDQLVIAIGTDLQFHKFATILSIDKNLIEKFISNIDRVKNREELMILINQKSKNLKTDELMKYCIDSNIPIGKIKTIDEVLNSDVSKEMILSENIEGIETKRIKSVAFKLTD
jgi:crotonobetainyl-CoA:carnitine CoA-transferase CaiB-like acyl-CoA transferase